MKANPMQRCCFDCEFFQLDGKDPNEITESDWDECAGGECHLNPPSVGDTSDVIVSDDRAFDMFPRVMACDWCGQFRQRKLVESDQTTQQVTPAIDVS